MRLPKLLRKGYLQVSGGHSIYFEECGNPRGVPVIFCHGGPGAEFSEKHKQFFDSKLFHAIFFDQRGCGKSKSAHALEHNTTWDLVSDIAALQDHFKISKSLIVGSSWGTTLALIFAIKHPQRVLGLLLTGIFLGTRAEIDFLYETAPRFFAPDISREIDDTFGVSNRRVVSYFRSMNGKDLTRAALAIKLMSLSETAVISPQLDVEKVRSSMGAKKPNERDMICGQYMYHDCYLSRDFILQNVDKMAHLPVIIINGRHDLVCPPMTADVLHQKLPRSKLFLVPGGHWSSEDGKKKVIIEQLNLLGKRFAKKMIE